MLKRKTSILLTALNAILTVTSAWGLIYQPQDYNDIPDANWRGWPNSNFMAMINDKRHKASATVIAPNFIITAGHVYCASGVEGDKIKIGTEKNYNYVIVDHRSQGGCSPNPDLAVYRIKKLEWKDQNDPNHPKDPEDANKSSYGMLKDANLDNWVFVYQGDDPNNECSELDKLIFTGSYGPQRICEFANAKAPIKVEAGKLHWGINVISSCNTSTLRIKYGRFQRGDYLKYEVCGGQYDSGVGWLIKDGDQWKIVGLYSGSISSQKISSCYDWIKEKVERMGGTLPSP